MRSDYLYSSIHSEIDDIVLVDNSVYLYGYSVEDRSRFADALKLKFPKVHFVKVEESGKDTVKVSGWEGEIALRSSVQITALLASFNAESLYIDVTGLDNRVCAAIIKNATDMSKLPELASKVKVIYVEPLFYDIKRFKAENVFNNLSERIEGIDPLPGFATIIPDDEDDIYLFALLGFEGGRFTHILESVQPDRENVIPIIGMPGFRLEYPYVTFWGNRRPLEETDTWRKMKFAAANSLVDVYLVITKFFKKHAAAKIKLAPIGTKPHAIGAMLLAVKYPNRVELIYDNPKKKVKRTQGIGNIIECEISKLISEN